MGYSVGDRVRIAMGITNEKIDLFNAKECVVGTIYSEAGDCYFVEVGNRLLVVPELAILSKVLEFTKEDLKPGMVVQHRNGEFSMVMPSDTGLILVNENRYIRLCGYTDNLCCFEDDMDIDIINVYGFNKKYRDALKIVLDGRELLWKRKEPKKMTVAEIKKLVEKITGEKIEVVDRIRKDRIIIGGSVFTDIDEALECLKKLSSLKQFK